MKIIDAAIKTYGVISSNFPSYLTCHFQGVSPPLSPVSSDPIQTELTTAAQATWTHCCISNTLQWQCKPDITDALVKIWHAGGKLQKARFTLMIDRPRCGQIASRKLKHNLRTGHASYNQFVFKIRYILGFIKIKSIKMNII